MPRINLNQIRTGSRQTDLLISGAKAIAQNPVAAGAILGNLANQRFGENSAFTRESFGRPSTWREPVSEKDLRYQGKGPHIIMFPGDLDNTHYMTFKALEVKNENPTKSPKNLIVTSIVLPIPGNLANNYAADYENAELGFLGALGAGDVSVDDVTAAVGQGYSALKKVGGQLASGAAQIITPEKKEDTKEARANQSAALGVGAVAAGTVVGAALAGSLLSGVTGVTGGAKIAKGMAKKAGIAVNPHMAVLFKGVGFKEHSFSYKFIARNKEESDEIQNICRVFREYMLPSYTFGGLAFEYPNEWSIEFSEHTSPYLYTIGKCVLKSMNITYNGAGVPAFTWTGAPAEVDVSLNFQEVEIETRNAKGKITTVGRGGPQRQRGTTSMSGGAVKSSSIGSGKGYK